MAQGRAIAVGGTAGTTIFAAGSLVLLGVLWRVWINRYRGTPGPFRLGWYLTALGGEIVAMNVAALILPKSYFAIYQAPVIGTIVGLHFIGVWLATDLRRFLYLSIGMTAINLAALALPANRSPAMLAGFGSSASIAAAVSA